jgi:hypothetical protein
LSSFGKQDYNFGDKDSGFTKIFDLKKVNSGFLFSKQISLWKKKEYRESLTS